MELILQINGDLCQTVAARDEARNKIAALSSKHLMRGLVLSTNLQDHNLSLNFHIYSFEYTLYKFPQ